MRSGIQQAIIQKEQNIINDTGFLTLDEINSKGHISSNGVAALLFSCYIILGGCYYTLAENNSPLESIYFCITTLMTIGYGDIRVKDRSFAIVFVLLGAGVVGTILGLVSFRAMEEQEILMNQRFTALADKFSSIIEDGAKIISAENNTEEVNRSPLSTITDKARNTISKVFQLKQKKKDLKEMNKRNIAAYDDEIFDLKITTLVNFLLFLITLFVGTMSMSVIEGWDFTTAAYWVNEIYDIHLRYMNVFICVRFMYV